MNLSSLELRVLGVLLEKELTTPDQYPLSLNGLMTGCNQKSSREPVMSLSADEVQNTTDALVKKGLVSEVLFGSRVAKYKHRFCNTEFSELHLTPPQLACICVLFLRGAQTAGELRTRTNRLHNFSDVSEVDACLEQMISREGEPWVQRLAREPGKRDCRYVHLFGGEELEAVNAPIFDSNNSASNSSSSNNSFSNSTDDASSASLSDGESSRVTQLELKVESLQRQVDELMQLYKDLVE